MAKKNNFWEENKITVVPLLCCAGFLMVMAGVYIGNRKYTDAQWERKHAKKVEAAVDTMNQVKDSIILPVATQQQKH